MLDHITLTVRDLPKTRAFYEKAFAPLGYKVLVEFGEFIGFGDRKPWLWLKPGVPGTTPMHIAFKAPSRDAVKAFYEAALAAGAKDNGPPGPRPHYHQHYFGAFVIDPNGHPIEAVCHAPA
jgi:catechol 2,3-dioxygenase-like lactoylglutathione lyase family enzyme